MRPLLLFPSCLVLALLFAEWVLLTVRGSVGTRTFVGPSFYPVHLVSFFLGTPALVNVLVLPDPAKRRAYWRCVVPIATALALILVLQQYSVSESLYGIDGNDGPFSRTDQQFLFAPSWW